MELENVIRYFWTTEYFTATAHNLLNYLEETELWYLGEKNSLWSWKEDDVLEHYSRVFHTVWLYLAMARWICICCKMPKMQAVVLYIFNQH